MPMKIISHNYWKTHLGFLQSSKHFTIIIYNLRIVSNDYKIASSMSVEL